MVEDDNIKDSDASYVGGSGGAVTGVSRADLERGFTDGEATDPNPADVFDTFITEPGGFLNRPHGWDR